MRATMVAMFATAAIAAEAVDATCTINASVADDMRISKSESNHSNADAALSRIEG